MRRPAGRLTAITTVLALAVTACSSAPEAPPAPPSAVASPSSAPTALPSPTPASTPAAATAPDPAKAYEDPDTLTRVLVAAESAIRDPDVGPADLTGWAWVQQALYRQLAARPEWHERVLAAMPERLRETARRNLDATVELRHLTAPREQLPPWRIVAPPPAEELLGAYRSAAAEFGIDWTYLAAIHLVESRMGRIRGDSTAGAKGPMQFLPSTWQAYGEGDIDDPHDAVRAAARYLADHGAPERMREAIFAYNHSDHYVDAVEHHAAVMRADERAYLAYHAWRVYYRLVSGDVVLEEGYDATSG